MAKSKPRRRRGGGGGEPSASSSSCVSAQNLPMDLITDILSRLPVKYLIRFKSVSKPWFSLIQSPRFVKLHLNFSKLNPNPIFSSILSLVETTMDKYVFRLNLIDALDKPIKMDLPFMSGRRGCRVLGISNGLLCAMFGVDYSPDIIVCNPVTRNFRRIPPFVCESWLEYCSFYGFNSNENGFQLIRINCRSGCVKVSSFSSSANVWKDVEVKIGIHISSTDLIKYLNPFYRNRFPIFKNGVYYWEGYGGGPARVVILDLFSKEVDVISAPYDNNVEELGLLEFKEQIMVVKLAYRELNLWILNEKDKTWRMFKRVDVIDVIPEDGLLKVLGCTGNGQLVLRDQYNHNLELYLYNIDTNDAKIFTCVNVEREYGMYLFAESLAAVQTGDFGDDV